MTKDGATNDGRVRILLQTVFKNVGILLHETPYFVGKMSHILANTWIFNVKTFMIGLRHIEKKKLVFSP